MSSNTVLFIDVAGSTPIVKHEAGALTDSDCTPKPMLSSKTCKKVTKDTIHCAECNHFKTNSVERMKHHIQSKHRVDNKYKCSMCQYTTYHGPLFREHVNRHQGIKPFKCELCSFTSVSKKYVKQHQEKHRACACGALCRNSHEFKRHARKCDSTGQWRRHCSVCDKPYADDAALKKHRRNVKPCDMCGVLLCNNARRRHMTDAHGAPPPEPAAKKYRFQCAHCPWSSSLQQKILLHLIHHPAQTVDETVVDVRVLRTCGIFTQ